MEGSSASRQSPRPQGKNAQKDWGPQTRRAPLFLSTLPLAVMKFASAQKKRKAEGLLSQMPSNTEQDENLETCGLPCISIPYCERFNNIQCFMVLYCILATAQGIIFGLVERSIVSYEMEYIVKTPEKVALELTYDISSAFVAIFLTYYGGRGKITKWIAFSSLFVGFGSLLFTLPYFTAHMQKPKPEIEDICEEMKTIIHCPRSRESFQSKYIYFFVLGQTVQGIAGMPLYTLAIAFLDDSVAAHSAGIYLGIADASAFSGYSVGYALGAAQMQASKNNASDNKNINSDNVQWRRKWRINFIVPALMAWLTFIPLLCFPPSIPGTAKIKMEKRKRHFIERKLKDKELQANIKDLFAAVWILMKNLLFMCPALCKAAEYLVFIGASEFMPIYLENAFLLTPKMAGLLTAMILVPGAALGSFLGGIVVSLLEMSTKALMRFTMAASILSIIFVSLILFVHCETVEFAGINSDYDGTGQLGNLTAPCNENCSCSSSIYASVCGRDEVEYFSPCFAGCVASKTINQHKAYYNCSCIDEGLTTSDEEGHFIDALPGKCSTKCHKLPLFFAFVFSSIIFSSACNVPLTLTIFRSVPDKLRSLALGITFVLIRIFGTIPGPLVFKMAAETSCIFWDINRCDGKRHCWIYNETKMLYIMVGICVFCKMSTVSLTALGFCTYDNLSKKSIENLDTPIKSVKAKKKGKD